jgi:hypothetical protein
MSDALVSVSCPVSWQRLAASMRQQSAGFLLKFLVWPANPQGGAGKPLRRAHAMKDLSFRPRGFTRNDLIPLPPTVTGRLVVKDGRAFGGIPVTAPTIMTTGEVEIDDPRSAVKFPVPCGSPRTQRPHYSMPEVPW